jgi:putative toxin-antitoxin system antitoxin component (TIGR02293 family)
MTKKKETAIKYSLSNKEPGIVAEYEQAIRASYSEGSINSPGIIKNKIVQLARIGLNYHAAVTIFHETGLPHSLVPSILGVHERSIQRYKKENYHLSKDQSEKILEIKHLYAKGAEVFGSKEKFSLWMDKYNRELMSKPLDMLDTHSGISLIMDNLVGIEHGIF